MVRRFTAIAVACAISACGSDETRSLQLVPVEVEGSDCGVPVDGRTMRVVALGDFPASATTGTQIQIEPGEIDISAFPASTRQLTVEVFGNAGARRAIGKTAPFALEDLEDGDMLPVFMAPPVGFCPSNQPGNARVAPLMARAGDRVLVAGGTDGDGSPVNAVELYDPANGRFTDLGDVLYGDDATGLIGAAMVEMPDGQVLVVGGASPAYQLYDPANDELGAPLFLPGARAHHAAVAIGGDEVLLAGGCSEVIADGSCEPASAVVETRILDVAGGSTRPGPALQTARFGGQAFADAEGTVVLLGGVDVAGDPLAFAERLDLVAGTAERIDGVGGVGAELLAGGLITSFAPPGAPRAASSSVIPPGAGDAVVVALAPQARAGATMTPLEDGRILVVGGVDVGSAEVATYVPVLAAYRVVADEPAMRRTDHGAVLLDDGSVLIVGGANDSGEALADAWVFRPELTGPFTADVSVSFGDAALAELVVPSDPAQVRIEPAADGQPAHYLIESSGGGGGLPSEWAVIGGPTFQSLELSARVRPEGGGVAILIGFVDAASYTAAVFLPGQAVTVFAVSGGVASPVDECAGEVIVANDLRPGSGATEIEMNVQLDSIEATIAGASVLSCAGMDALARGNIGVGVIGDESAELRVDSLLVSR